MRWRGSNHEMETIEKMLRIHSYIKHEEVNFMDLRSFNLSLKVADRISVLLQKDFDIPDVILRLEEIAIRRQYFSLFLKEYISEEYAVRPDYSFTVIALLHYQRDKNLSIDEAFEELVLLSSPRTLCHLCCSSGSNREEKVKVSYNHNLLVLRDITRSQSGSESDDLSIEDDSFNDPIYKAESENDSCEEDNISSDDRKSNDDFNPFDSTSDEDLSLPALNSTVSFNPFDSNSETDDDASNKIITRSSMKCEYCSKAFSNKHNMKLHVIRYIIFIIQIY